MQPDARQFQLPQDDAGARLREAHRDGHGERGVRHRLFAQRQSHPRKPPPPLELADQHLIISCDATQASAIARARTGASYIIQGPPGTGKSQTITNLIADYVARGKRVLFVCEKRAAIDVVFHRLRQQGLDELCCLIHDSQTDKKAFIQNLKQTYEKFLSQAELDADADKARATTLRAMEQDLAEPAAVFRSDAATARATRASRCVRCCTGWSNFAAAPGSGRRPMEDLLPDYPLWLQHGELVDRLRCGPGGPRRGTCALPNIRSAGWARACWRRTGRSKRCPRYLDQAEELLDAIESALELSGLPGELWDTFEEIQAILEFAVRARPLAERNLLGVLTKGPAASEFDDLAGELDCEGASARCKRSRRPPRGRTAFAG